MYPIKVTIQLFFLFAILKLSAQVTTTEQFVSSFNEAQAVSENAVAHTNVIQEKAIETESNLNTSTYLDALSQVTIYPNIIDATTNIQGAKDSELVVYGSDGRILLTYHIVTDKEELDFSSLVSGIYYAKIYGMQEKVSVIKIVKE